MNIPQDHVPLTRLESRRQGQALEGPQEGREGTRRGGLGVPGEAKSWYVFTMISQQLRSDKTAADAKARAEMAAKAKGKGPLNAGTQGIKKSGKK